jgi:hypothetical protein
MTVKKGAEAIEVAVANTLSTYLPTQLTAISAVWNDGVPLPAPVAVFAGQRQLVREYPAVVVASLDGTEVADGAPLWGEQEHRLDVSVVCLSDDQHILDVQTKRYLVAIWEVLKQNQLLDGSISGLAGVQTRRYGRSEQWKANEKGRLMLQAAGWEIVVHVTESV